MKRITALILVLVLLISSASFAAISPTDAGQELKEMGFIKGDANGDLQPEKVLTREEALVTTFSDVPKDHWAAKRIAYGYEAGIVNGVGENKFGLAQKVTKQAYLTMLLRVLGYDGADTYDKAFELAAGLKIYASPEDGDSVAKATDLTGEAQFVKRGEAFVMMYNALNTKLVGSNQTLLESLKSVKNSANVPKASDYARAYTTATLPNFTEKADKVVVTEDSVSFVDARGKEITVAKNPQKVRRRNHCGID
ncbi:MAG: hypothetical protein CSB19_02025 [Clostridiales bacterium]|nr:MAG: hypothetical protein CSB19_02025 [Clostridiales bacterium]